MRRFSKPLVPEQKLEKWQHYCFRERPFSTEAPSKWDFAKDLRYLWLVLSHPSRTPPRFVVGSQKIHQKLFHQLTHGARMSKLKMSKESGELDSPHGGVLKQVVALR